MSNVIWDVNTKTGGTWFQGYFPISPDFQTTLARLTEMSQQDGEKNAGDKSTATFVGTFKGEPFTIYEYKGCYNFHVGGTDALDINGLLREVCQEMWKNDELG